jgi:hypothetical protein
MTNKTQSSTWFKVLIVIFSGILVTAVFFRTQLLSHGTLLFGDHWDGFIAFGIIQHWYNFFQGMEHWSDLNYFYPYTKTLGYNDSYFLYGVFYSIFRFLKINIFTALELTNAAIRLIGFYAFFYLCYRQLSLKFFVCLLTAAIFSLSNAVYNESMHVQLLSVSFAPLLTIFLINYCRQLFVIQNTYKAILWGSAAGIFYATWLLSAYYIAWFYSLFCFFWLICTLILHYKHKQLSIKKPAWIAILIPAIITSIALTPFLMVYLPIAHQTGMRRLWEALYYTPTILNLFNLGDTNLIWGRLLSYFNLPNGEFLVGYPFVFLTLLIAAIAASIKDNHQHTLNFYRPLAYAIIASILVSILIFHKISLWYFVWQLFPGAKGLRVVCRYWIFLFFPMNILLAYYLSERMRWSPAWMYILIPSILLLEQINTAAMCNLDVKVEQGFINSIGTAPSQCQVFFVTNTRHQENKNDTTLSDILSNMDAIVISEFTGRKSINGISSYSPPDWNFRYFPQNTYLDRVQVYAQKHNIKNLCSFDLEKMQWHSK